MKTDRRKSRVGNEALLWILQNEKDRQDRSGIYGYTQRTLAYNSNRIAGSTLTETQTAALFAEGYLPSSDEVYKRKDIEEMNGHFLMFNYMLDTLEEDLSEELIKHFHHELKSGVFEDRANGYAIGEYKKRANMVGMYKTALPNEVAEEMAKLLEWYNMQEKSLHILAEFHAKYEIIHPFQDGNGRTGRMILFRECLKNPNICPFIIRDDSRNKYIEGLMEYREKQKTDKIVLLMEKEAEEYYQQCKYFME